MVRQDQEIFIAPPSANLNEFEDGERTTVLFKVICAYGKYFLYHKDSLLDDDFCDTSHMAHYILKNFKSSQIGDLIGDHKKKIFRGHYLNKMQDKVDEATQVEPEDVVNWYAF